MPAALSIEARARIVADAVGKISDGDPRGRVFKAACVQLRSDRSAQFLRPSPLAPESAEDEGDGL